MTEPILMRLVMIEFQLLMNMMITILMQCALNNLELYVVTSKPNGKFNHVLNFGKQLQRL